ncbi:MAG: phosphohistidine phosphatase SixA, partial [Terriglobia bacterium]
LGGRGPNLRSSRNQGRGRASFQIIVMRHGIAAKRGVPVGSDDAKRPLTSKGKQRTEQIAAGLNQLGCDVDWIVTSPLVRAAETAELVAASFRRRVPVDTCAALRPGGSPEDLLSFLAKNPERKRVLLVGHEPDLSQLAARLIGAGSQANLAFKKGGCCLIRFDDDPSRSTGQLVWWLTPRLLRAIP